MVETWFGWVVRGGAATCGLHGGGGRRGDSDSVFQRHKWLGLTAGMVVV